MGFIMFAVRDGWLDASCATHAQRLSRATTSGMRAIDAP